MINNEKVDILLSVYRPDKNYLIKQLQSIENQTYSNIEVLIYDDCVEERCDIELFNKILKKTPFKILPYQEQNIYYHRAFAKLTEYSTGDYLAYCDQDDIWMPEKIKECVKVLKEENALLVASDRQIIDSDDNVVIKSVRAVSNTPQESWKTGDNITKFNVFLTYAVGMSLVVKGDFARSILPFTEFNGHDNWLLSCAATEGKVAFIDKPLVQYRRHGKNVSGVLSGIKSKEQYYKSRVKKSNKAIEDLFIKYPNHPDKDEIMSFANAREEKRIRDLIKYRYLSPDIAKFEICLVLIPDWLFPILLWGAKTISKKR